MAERQETSVMASINDILRAAKEEEARAQEQSRLDTVRKQQEEEDRARQAILEEERRMKSEEDERQRRAFEEQRRQAEIAALQEATIQKAKMEAEAQARLAEMAARQAHEAKLHSFQHDKSKKTLKMAVIGASAFLVVALVGGGIIFKIQYDKAQAQSEQLQALQDKIAKAEEDRIKLQSELSNTKDPQKIAELQAKLAEKESAIININKEISANKGGGGGPVRAGGGGPAVKPAGGGGGPKPACNCSPGDPLCSCL